MVTGTQGLQWAVECQSAAKSHAACESSSKWVTQHLGCLCSSSWEQETSPPQQAVPWGSGGSSPGPACPCVVFPPPARDAVQALQQPHGCFDIAAREETRAVRSLWAHTSPQLRLAAGEGGKVSAHVIDELVEGGGDCNRRGVSVLV